jgi:endonuclease/exonuclease/phosphatase family metal-dependent hydrolase
MCRVLSLIFATVDQSTSALEHSLQPFFPAIAQFSSISALEESALYEKLRPEIERILSAIVQEDYAASSARPFINDGRRSAAVRVTAWNIERGIKLDGVMCALREHPLIRESDVLLLTELDYGMARTKNRFIAREIAEALKFNYAFAPCYIALNKGSGLESEMPGENAHALHGNALFSRYPLQHAHSFALPNGKDKMRGKEKRLGCQRAVVGEVEHPAGRFRAVSLHLDAHSTQRHRHRQMRLLLDHLETLTPRLPVVIGGDWNTSTYNSRRAVYSIAGFFRRVMMGVGHAIENHYLHPERWFERSLFRELERRGYRYRELNEHGVGTLHYDVKDLATNVNMRDWIPRWCFWFINWALKEHNGRCSLKLDWFAGKEIAPVGQSAKVVTNLRDIQGGVLSDHDPIVLDFILEIKK